MIYHPHKKDMHDKATLLLFLCLHREREIISFIAYIPVQRFAHMTHIQTFPLIILTLLNSI